MTYDTPPNDEGSRPSADIHTTRSAIVKDGLYDCLQTNRLVIENWFDNKIHISSVKNIEL